VKRIRILEDAVVDLEAGRQFYDRMEAGVGDYFVQSMLADLERLNFLHGIHTKQFGLYRMMAGRFPFAIYYRDGIACTDVIAILDLRRNPAWIRAELEGRTD
jgi:hypothetical protein